MSLKSAFAFAIFAVAMTGTLRGWLEGGFLAVVFVGWLIGIFIARLLWWLLTRLPYRVRLERIEKREP